MHFAAPHVATQPGVRNAEGCHACRYAQPSGGTREYATVFSCRLQWYRSRNQRIRKPRLVSEHYICSHYDKARAEVTCGQ